MPAPIPLPDHVKQWISNVFAVCNERTSAKMTRMPSVHEESLDLTFIEQLSQFSAPVALDANWIVHIDTHFLGGRRHYRNWEIADIGILVVFRRNGKAIRSKVGLLQSKRLYSEEQEYEEATFRDYEIGFGRLFGPDEIFAELATPGHYGFTEGSTYRALKIDDNQYNAIKDYEGEFGIPVYYLFYNPWQIPHSVAVPVVHDFELEGSCEVGCRVLPASDLRSALADRDTGSPSYGELKYLLPEPFTAEEHTAGWRIEHFVTELLLECERGYIAESRDDPGLFRVFARRTGPIGAAIAVTIDFTGG